MSDSYLHKNLRFLRKKNKWRQSEMMDRCGISANTWSNYENNVSQPGLEKVIELSKIFGVNIDDLLLRDLEKDGSMEILTADDNPKNLLNEEDSSLTTWVILGHLKQIDEKIDRLLSAQSKSGKQE